MRPKTFLVAGLIVALTLVAIAALFFLFKSKIDEIQVPTGARSGDYSVKPGVVEIEGVRYQSDTGVLVVPENRAKADSRLIALPVKRIRSMSLEAREPVFLFNGGPGVSNLKFQVPAVLLAAHDVVIVGYRGVDGSSVLDSRQTAAAMRGVKGEVLSDESLDNIARAVEADFGRNTANGVDLDGYTIPEVVEDMEAARNALGYERVNLLSKSYGTRVAQIYATMHPEHLLRSVQIGVNPPGHFWWSPQATDEQVVRYATLAQEDPEARKLYPDLAATIQKINRQMPRNWLLFPIDAGKVRVTAFALLYHRSTAPAVFDAYRAAEQGDPSGLALMSVAYDFMLAGSMNWADLMLKGGSADFTPGTNYRAVSRTETDILGAPMSQLVWGAFSRGWPMIDESYRQVQTSDVETLLVSGSLDFTTPPQPAQKELLPSLTRGRHVVISEQGHTDDFWKFQPEAAARLLTSFYDTGVADDSHYRYLPMSFEVKSSFPLIAKLSLAGIILMGAVVVFLAVVLIRRQKKKRKNRGLVDLT